MRWILLAAGTIAAALVVAALIGWRLPRSHRASREQIMLATPESIWAAITDVEAFPSWRSRRQEGAATARPRGTARVGRGRRIGEDHLRGRAHRRAAASGHAYCRSRSTIWRHVDLRNHTGGTRLTIKDYRGRRDLQSGVSFHGAVRLRVRRDHCVLPHRPGAASPTTAERFVIPRSARQPIVQVAQPGTGNANGVRI